MDVPSFRLVIDRRFCDDSMPFDYLSWRQIANALNKEQISTDMSASVYKSSPLGRKTGFPDIGL